MSSMRSRSTALASGCSCAGGGGAHAQQRACSLHHKRIGGAGSARRVPCGRRLGRHAAALAVAHAAVCGARRRARLLWSADEGAHVRCLVRRLPCTVSAHAALRAGMAVMCHCSGDGATRRARRARKVLKSIEAVALAREVRRLPACATARQHAQRQYTRVHGLRTRRRLPLPLLPCRKAR